MTVEKAVAVSNALNDIDEFNAFTEEIERLSGNNNIKDQKKLRSICGKQEKFLAKQKSLNIPELEKLVNNNIFA